MAIAAKNLNQPSIYSSRVEYMNSETGQFICGSDVEGDE